MTKLNLQAEHRDKIRNLVKVRKDNTYQFLGYTLNLETNQFHDLLEKGTVNSDWGTQSMTALLAHYSLAKNTAKTGKLLKFKDPKIARIHYWDFFDSLSRSPHI